MNEKLRRLAAVHEALTLGYGGISVVARVIGLSIPAIRAGLAELEAPNTVVRTAFAGPEWAGNPRRKRLRPCWWIEMR